MDEPIVQPTWNGQPMPVPTLVTVGQVQVGSHMLVSLQVQAPTGVSVFFLDAAAARTVGENLAKLGAAGDLLVANGSVPGPG